MVMIIGNNLGRAHLYYLDPNIPTAPHMDDSTHSYDNKYEYIDDVYDKTFKNYNHFYL